MIWLILGLVVAAGGYIGVALDRMQRRHDPPPRQARSLRHLHVIEDEWHTPDVKIRERDDQ